MTASNVVTLMDRLLREGHDGGNTPLPFQRAAKSWVRPVYNAYLQLLVEENYLDFGALLVYCLRLLRERPRLVRHYRTVYPFACVDEYQDTNGVQDLLLRAIYPSPDANLFVVADDDQIIYQWNGASPKRLRKLRKHYRMKVVQLPESFRCPPAVVRLANNLIRHNADRISGREPLVSAVADSNVKTVRLRRLSDVDEEMAWVADDITGRHLRPGECTVLARSGKLLERAADSLRDVRLSPYLIKRKLEFESPLLRFIHAALRLANKPGDDEQLFLLCSAFCDLTGQNVPPEDVEDESRLCGDSRLRAFANIALTTSVQDSSLLRSLRNHLLDRLKYRQFVNDMFEWRAQPAELEQEEREVWKNTERSVRQALGGDPPLAQFLQELDLRKKTPPPGPNDVQCLTIHLAKGKEFDHVYLVGLAEDQLPSYYAVQQDKIEEERRSCFVAITRVQSSLTMTYADSYFGWPKEPSRFLTEMGLSMDQGVVG